MRMLFAGTYLDLETAVPIVAAFSHKKIPESKQTLGCRKPYNFLRSLAIFQSTSYLNHQLPDI